MHTSTRVVCRILHSVTVIVATTLMGSSVWATPVSVRTEFPPQATVSIYTRADGLTREELSLIVAGIEADANVSVYQLPPERDAGTPAPRRTERPMLARNEAVSIAVVYPDIGEPFRSVFAKIIEGIEDKTKERVMAIPVGAEASTQAVADELRRQNIKVVIALGRHGLRVASTLDRDIGVVAGGVISAPEAEARVISVLSLAPDPDLMFGRLKDLMPGARRVHVVFDPKTNAWLIRLARDAAARHGLELRALEATDLRSAVRHYQQILSTADPKQDALWLPQDSTTVEDSAVLPLVLEKSWDRSLVVFSSSVAHVRRGALFSLYPNNLELGRNLADSALGYLASGERPGRGVTPLKDVLLAVNVRTAGHLGLRLGYEQQRRFDLVFPQP